MDLNIEDIEKRLSIIEADIERLRSEPNNARKIQALNEYRDYLKDELKRLKENGY